MLLLIAVAEQMIAVKFVARVAERPLRKRSIIFLVHLLLESLSNRRALTLTRIHKKEIEGALFCCCGVGRDTGS